MNLKTIAICVLAVSIMAGTASADRCLGYEDARIVWCDDFDSYCVGGSQWLGYPPFPATCATDGSAVADSAAFQANWPKGDCGLSQVVNDDSGVMWNAPFAVKMGKDSPARHTHVLTSAIQAQDPGKNAVKGTDANPLTLTYYMNFGTIGGGPLSPFYIELALGDDKAPTDYVMADCQALVGEAGLFPIVVQQRQNANIVVPHPLPSTEIHASLAFGTLSLLNTNPCDLQNGRKPTNYHAAFFDGHQWWDLRNSVFPGSGDFNEVDGKCWFTMVVKTSTVDVTFQSPVSGTSTATIPRQYLGPFDTVAFGTGPGCELDPTNGTCIGSSDCLDYTGWIKTYWDTPVLVDGELVSLEGACCKPDGTCEVVSEDVCVNTYGGTFAGTDTTCEEVICCPQPFADADADGDVDQADFGAWQLCYTNTNGGVLAGCECFNRDDDSDVDGDDFLAFSACWSGAGVAADPNCE